MKLIRLPNLINSSRSWMRKLVIAELLGPPPSLERAPRPAQPKAYPKRVD